MDIIMIKKGIAIAGIILAFFMAVPYELFDSTKKYEKSIRWSIISLMFILVIVRFFILE